MKDDPLNDFHSNGLLGAQCVIGFLQRYAGRGASMAVAFAETRFKFCTFAQVACQIAKLAADLLHITPTPTSADAPVQFMAKHKTWKLLDHEVCYQEV